MKRLRLAVYSIILIALLSVATYVRAQSNGDYELTWTRSGVGGVITGGDYDLVSAVAQPEAGSTQIGSDYSLNGGVIDVGVLVTTTPEEYRVFMPLTLR